MISLLRIDFERARKSKTPYIFLGILILCLFFSGLMLLIVLKPELRNAALDLGMEITVDDQLDFSFLTQKSHIEVLHSMVLDGGGLYIFLCIIMTLFVCNDFESGFTKNIFSLEQKRWKYLISKLIVIQVLCVIYIIAMILALFLFTKIVGITFASSPLMDYLKFILFLCAINGGFCAQSLAVSMLTRSKAAGIAAAIIIPGGLLVSIIEPLCNMFHFSIFKWTLYGTIKLFAFPLTSSQLLFPFLVVIAWTIVWITISAVLIQKKDIA